MKADGGKVAWRVFLGKVPLGIAFAALSFLLLVRSDHRLLSHLALLGVGAVAYEISGLLGRGRVQGVAFAMAVMASCLMSKWLLSDSRESLDEFLFLSLLAWLVVTPLFLARPPTAAPGMQAALWGFFLVSAWLSLAVLAEYDRWMLVTGLVAVWLADTCAWYCGSRFGKRSLVPTISPSKKWEGVYGSLVGLFAFATLFRDVFFAEARAHWLALAVAAGVTGLTVLGDLTESALKRVARVKNSGRLLGSHGGVFDRVDSWLPVLPFLALLSSLKP